MREFRGSRSFLTVAVVAAAFTLSAAAAAQADNVEAGSSDHLTALETCRDLLDPSARLACFDQQVARMLAAADAGELRLLDQQAMQDTRRRLFGFSLPRIGLFGGGKGDEAMDTLESTITKVTYQRSDAFTFEIAEGGATWQITNAPQRLIRPKVGDPVVFKSASMGSYFIRINGQIGVKGRRVQ